MVLVLAQRHSPSNFENKISLYTTVVYRFFFSNSDGSAFVLAVGEVCQD